MPTVLEIIKKTTEFFVARGVESARLNAELLVGHALGLKRMELYLQFERVLGEGDLGKIRPLVKRRGQREPLQYILGETEFSGLRLKTDRRALIPRPETELLVEKIVGFFPTPPRTILDLGTGSGAIALALANAFPTAAVTGVDTSEDALTLARENAGALALTDRVRLFHSDWFAAVPTESRFGLIVANPPYLSPCETVETSLEVRGFEPVSALQPSTGSTGLEDLHTVIAGAPRFLATGGLLALETGPGQHPELLELLRDVGFTRRVSEPDLTRRDRFLFAWL
ncbi:MAG: peptide chain release factor N(5)-glutamine methyltransferase [Opitutaceae bacterium]